jgi:hypothetical protein
MGNQNSDDIPRRAHLDYMHPAERAIYDAAQVVEKMGADARLMDAVDLLQKARDKVGDFIDSVEP